MLVPSAGNLQAPPQSDKAPLLNPPLQVVLEDDPDAPTFPYPPCRLLGHGGLQCVASRRSAPGVQAVLARLRGGRCRARQARHRVCVCASTTGRCWVCVQSLWRDRPLACSLRKFLSLSFSPVL